jgi:hypothetical protein
MLLAIACDGPHNPIDPLNVTSPKYYLFLSYALPVIFVIMAPIPFYLIYRLQNNHKLNIFFSLFSIPAVLIPFINLVIYMLLKSSIEATTDTRQEFLGLMESSTYSLSFIWLMCLMLIPVMSKKKLNNAIKQMGESTSVE